MQAYLHTPPGSPASSRASLSPGPFPQTLIPSPMRSPSPSLPHAGSLRARFQQPAFDRSPSRPAGGLLPSVTFHSLFSLRNSSASQSELRMPACRILPACLCIATFRPQAPVNLPMVGCCALVGSQTVLPLFCSPTEPPRTWCRLLNAYLCWHASS